MKACPTCEHAHGIAVCGICGCAYPTWDSPPASDVVGVTVEGDALEDIKTIAKTALLIAGNWEAAVTYCDAAKQLCEQLRDGVL